VDSTRFDSMSKQLATGATRRRAIAGLGALAIGGVAGLGLAGKSAAQVSTEDARRRCIERCIEHAGDNQNLRQVRNRCRRRCENR
jgi:hypothetical protein